MEEQATYRMNGRVVLRRIGEDRLLVPVSGDVARENCVFPINETGEFMWARLAKGMPPEEVAQALVRTFAVDAETAGTDCRGFVAALVAQRLLERAAP